MKSEISRRSLRARLVHPTAATTRLPLALLRQRGCVRRRCLPRQPRSFHADKGGRSDPLCRPAREVSAPTPGLPLWRLSSLHFTPSMDLELTPRSQVQSPESKVQGSASGAPALDFDLRLGLWTPSR